MELNFDNMSVAELLERISKDVYDKQPLSGTGSVFTQLTKRALEVCLQTEMDIHIKESKKISKNRRNGLTVKQVSSQHGSFDLETPRDRNGSFEPKIVEKRQTKITKDIDNKILTLYSYGASYEKIREEIANLYGLEVSNAQISIITDKILEDAEKWRNRPLDDCYPIVFLDAMYFKVRKGKAVVTHVVYNLMGITKKGKKEILGFYTCESEGASFWLGVLDNLKSRGVNDILIACVDGLQGFPEAINDAFPKTCVQLCVVHQVRNSLKRVASKDKTAFLEDLKKVYTADSKKDALIKLQELKAKWSKYDAAIKKWESNWGTLSNYFDFSAELRRLIYTTNPIESFHRQIRKVTKTKGAFTSENALIKLVYCAIINITKKWTKPINNWSGIAAQLEEHFPNRLSIAIV